MRKFFCDECGNKIKSPGVTVASIDISIPSSLVGQFSYGNTAATLDLLSRLCS